MEEFGSTSNSESVADTTADIREDPVDLKLNGGKLILDEEREVGAVSWHVYYSYAKSMGSMWWAVAFGTFLGLSQVAQVFNSLFLGFWTGAELSGWSNGAYMAVYAGERSISSFYVTDFYSSRCRAGTLYSGCSAF